MDAAHFEKTLSSEVLFEGRVVTLTKDVALLENGETSIREVVHHHGGACIVPYFEDGTLCMVRQFRYAMQQELWELPAGKLEKGEDPFEAAKRELGEECGLTAVSYTHLTLPTTTPRWASSTPRWAMTPRSSICGWPPACTPPRCIWTTTSS